MGFLGAKFLIENPYFILPSRGEGLPRAMIEAMACSCVAVGSNIGGIKELVEDKFIVKANILAIPNASPFKVSKNLI